MKRAKGGEIRDSAEVLRQLIQKVLGMPAEEFVWDPERWRFLAEEARTIGDQMTNEEARTIMRRIAMDYDRLARLAARIVTGI